MSIEGLIISAVIVLVLLFFVLAPLIWQRRVILPADVIEKQRTRAIHYYERVLKNVRDLDEDFATGKIDEAEYQAEREHWVNRGVQVLQLLDQLDDNRAIVDDASADDAAIDAAIEASLEHPEPTQPAQAN